MQKRNTLRHLLCAACASTLFFSISHAQTVLTTQAEVDAAINTPLLADDVIYDTTNIVDQIKPTEDIRIAGEENSKHDLTITSLGTPSTADGTWHNLFIQDHNLTFQNIHTLTLDMTNIKNPTFPYEDYKTINTWIKNGDLLVDSSVENFVAKMPKVNSLSHNGNLSMSGGSLKILSPHIFIENAGDLGGLAISNQAIAYFGDENNRVKDITINNTSIENDDVLTFRHQLNSLDIGEKSQLIVNADTMTIKNTNVGVWMLNHGVANMGLSDQPLKTLTFDNVTTGIYMYEAGTFNAHTQNIFIIFSEFYGYGDRYPQEDPADGYGIWFTKGGAVNITNGTEENPGEFVIRGRITNSPQNTFGIMGSAGNKYYDPISLQVKHGNFTLKDVNYGLFLNITDKDKAATLNFDVNRFKIEHIAVIPILNINGDINIQAKERIDISEPTLHNIAIQNSGGSITILGQDTTTMNISGEIRNMGRIGSLKTSTIKMNFANENASFNGVLHNGSSLNATTLASSVLSFSNKAHFIGTVLNRGDKATTNLTFTKGSYFAGNAINIMGGETNLTFDSGATWQGIKNHKLDNISVPLTLTNLKTQIGVDVNLNTDGGNIILAADKTYDVNEFNAIKPYNILQVRHLNAPAQYNDKDGTFVFRTQLETNEKEKKVGGYPPANGQLTLLNDIMTINESSHGKHKISVIDTSSTKPEKGMALLVQDFSADPKALFEEDISINDGTFFGKKAIIVSDDAIPDEYKNYTDLPTTGKNWYLALTKEPLPTPDGKPNINGQIHLDFANSTYLWHTLMQDNVFKRWGHLPTQTTQGIWARLIHGEHKEKDLNHTLSYSVIDLGYQGHGQNNSHGTRYNSLSYNYIDGENTFYTTHAKENISGHVLSYMLTQVYNSGHYLDIVGKLGRVTRKLEYIGDFNDKASYQTGYYGLSTEWGREKTYANGTYIVPQIQLSYGHLDGASYHSENNIE